MMCLDQIALWKMNLDQCKRACEANGGKRIVAVANRCACCRDFSVLYDQTDEGYYHSYEMEGNYI